ncbi:MAG: aspartate carbamoyltransferase catalytic subunit [Phycisphaerales bacterium]|nr:aspartate carbamoyltransferase catalytic subunit [Phycisphaerales bacterium]
MTTAPRTSRARLNASNAHTGPILPSEGLHALGTLSPDQIRGILARARDLASVANDPATRLDALRDRTIATCFFESSTRTRLSFTLAAERCGARVVDLGTSSSTSKGESIADTARTIAAMGVSAFIVRSAHAGASSIVASATDRPTINAGDGKHEHPTQGLLDTLTLAQAARPDRVRDGSFDLTGLRIAIVGDVASSRVARSAIAAMTPLGAEIVCVGPPNMVPASLASLVREPGSVRVERDLDALLPGLDAVMMLRIQFERHAGAGGAPGSSEGVPGSPQLASLREYRERYGLTRERASRLRPNAWIMHPGPTNLDIELDASLIDCARSLVRRQVANGVAVRMAVLLDLLGT